MTDKYRLIQNGQPVVWVDGLLHEALREINQYAAVYGHDGPVKIETLVDDEWTWIE